MKINKKKTKEIKSRRNEIGREQNLKPRGSVMSKGMNKQGYTQQFDCNVRNKQKLKTT